MTHNFDPIWRVKARDEGRLRETKQDNKTGRKTRLSRSEALRAWSQIEKALASSDLVEDRQLAADVHGFVLRQPTVREVLKQHREAGVQDTDRQPQAQIAARHDRPGPEMAR